MHEDASVQETGRQGDEDLSPPTRRGRVIGDQEIQRLADEVEVGYDPTRLRRRLVRPAPTPPDGHTSDGPPGG